MPMWKKNLQRIALIVIVILGVKTSIEGLLSTVNMPGTDTAVVNWDERISTLTAHIPIKRGTIGYISNEDIPGAAFDEDDSSAEYILTQFAVAPLILIRGTGEEWNILNLDLETYEIWNRTNVNNFEVISFGGGLYLIRKAGE